MKYFSTFSGIGGFELGIQQAHEILNMGRTTSSSDTEDGRYQSLSDNSNGNGRRSNPTCIGFSEIDKYATAVYQHHFPTHKPYGDITKINAEELPDFDLLVGGFPCQSFSIAGKRRGFEDTRGTMFFELARILRTKKPRLFVFENVKGLLSHDNGNTFKTIIATIDELGYDCQWQVLNSKDFGVPQNRERVFIVGHLRGTPRPQVFPFVENDLVYIRKIESKQGRAQTETTHTLRGSNIKADQAFIVHNVYGGFGEKKIRELKDHSPTIRTPAGGGHLPMVIQKSQDWREKGTLRKFEKTSPTLRANMGDNHPMILQRGRGKNKGGAHTLAPTMTGKSYQDNNHVGGVRRLTPVECERLQGFPDQWTVVCNTSDSQRYKMCGNAVTTNVVQAIMEKLL